MKQKGIIKEIFNNDDKGYTVRLTNCVAKFRTTDLFGFDPGDNVNVLYRVDEAGVFVIEQIDEYSAPELNQREKDITSSVIMKILSDMVCNGKIKNNKDVLLKEGLQWHDLYEKLRI